MSYYPNNYQRPNWTPGVDANSPAISKLNTGYFTCERLHQIWLACARNWRDGYFDKLNDCLDLVWVELYADAKPDEVKMIEDFDKQIAELNSMARNTRNYKQVLDAKVKYALAIKFKYLYLKKVEKSQGMGKAYRDESEDDFE